MHVPLCPVFEHKLIMARRLFPAGSYMKADELTICVVAGGRLAPVSGPVQPFIFIKSSEARVRTVLLVVSLTAREMDSKVIPPVLVNSISTHQPVPVQFSMPLKEAEKLGVGVDVAVAVGVKVGVVVDVCVAVGVRDGVEVRVAVGKGLGVRVGVGVGGGVNIGRRLGMPVRLANLPHNQQDSPGRSGLRMIQYSPFALRPTTSATSPTCNAPTLGYTSPGPVRQFVSTETRICGVPMMTGVNVGKGVAVSGFVAVGVGDSGPVMGIPSWAV